MNTAQVECFLSLANTLSFTRTAEELYKTQSVVSRQIQSLENELGIVLIERDSRRVELTAAGKIMYEAFVGIEESYHTALRQATQVDNGLRGEISLCVPAGQFLDSAIKKLISDFEHKYPNVEIRFVADHPQAFLRKILDGQLDFAYTRQGWQEAYKTISCIHVTNLGNHLILPKSYSLEHVDLENPSIDDFTNIPFTVLPDKEGGASHRRAIESFLDNAKNKPEIIVAPNLASLILMTEMGQAATIANSMNSQLYNPNVKNIKLKDFPYTKYALCWNNANVSPCAELFIKFLKDYTKNLQNKFEVQFGPERLD